MHGSFSDPRSSAFIGGHTVLLGFFGWLGSQNHKEDKEHMAADKRR
jgi:hypothetical protein